MKLTLDNISKKYKDQTALENINVELQSGQLIGLIGKNGAGKTTLIKLIATIIKPTRGHIFLDNQDIIKKSNIMRNVIGYLPQEVSFYPNLTAYEYLNYFASIKGMNKQEAKKQIEKLLSSFHLEDTKNKRLGSFSGGMKQRIGIICALLGNPQVIVIDEPTTGLDPEERITVRNVLSKLAKDRIVLLSTHIVSDIEAVASRILMLQHGKLIFNDSPNELITKASGCVWEYTVPSLSDNMKGISNMVQTKEGIHIRQVCCEKPEKDAFSFFVPALACFLGEYTKSRRVFETIYLLICFLLINIPTFLLTQLMLVPFFFYPQQVTDSL